ncbi:MAG TPA: hydroxymethylpyrimidine/phosphomethylpyrimidine kinase [Anaeromyxobacteraceae bacterium]|nr:hydroxymethylpyrimidine/phosphomethylpyrimidine kinase [Anaeromyxobacteraceae bacterium]
MSPVLVVAGLDPSGGAGIAADAEAVTAFDGTPWLVASALTAQGPAGARGWWPVAPDVVLAQLEALLGPRSRPRAMKTGMIGSAAAAVALAQRLAERPLGRVPLVVDPVLAASSGLALVSGAPPRAAFEPLLARATLATPNWIELAILAGREVATEDDAIRAARELPSRAVLVKGGHRDGAPVDLLVRGRAVARFTGKRVAGTARGTGCRLASAIAAQLARGVELEAAVAAAKRYVEAYIRGVVAATSVERGPHLRGASGRRRGGRT